MVLLEFSMTPLTQGESVSPYVARSISLIKADCPINLLLWVPSSKASGPK